MRINEVLGLMISDIEFSWEYITVVLRIRKNLHNGGKDIVNYKDLY